ncbi:MAG: DUF1853 family protein [Pseudomonadota bacterium]
MTDTGPEPWLSYQEPAVRDLVWLIASAPLLPSTAVTDLSCSSGHWPEHNDYLNLYGRHEAWLRALDAAPEPLLAALGRARDLRLGRYAEDLLLFWLAAPDNAEFELIAEHVALREQGITLGELDFLVRERRTGQLWHIELALKFYLGTADQQWLGPNRQDSLARKLKHLCQQQLPLLQSPAGQRWLQSQQLENPRTWGWLKGRLFTAFSAEAATDAAQWFTPDALIRFAGQHRYDWYSLAKQHWLATGLSAPSQHASFATDGSLRHFPVNGIQALIAYDGEREVLRAFVVGNAWAPAPLSPCWPAGPDST